MAAISLVFVLSNACRAFSLTSTFTTGSLIGPIGIREEPMADNLAYRVISGISSTLVGWTRAEIGDVVVLGVTK